MKRLHDASIWDKPWFRKLAPIDKCAFGFIKDKCDNVGVWVPDFESAEFFIGAEVDWEALPEKLNGNIRILDNGKWFLVDFCEFQHKDLISGSTSNACKSYVSLLLKHDLLQGFMEKYEGFAKPWGSLCEGYRVREEVKVKEEAREEIDFEAMKKIIKHVGE